MHEDVAWPFAEERREAIDRHWDAVRGRQPSLFDGRVLMQTRGAVVAEADGPVFRGAYATVSFRAFLAWRDFGHPGTGFRNGFGMAALRGSDGAFVLGEMAPHTANAGRIYFPSGTPDLSDVADGVVDIAGSIRRELVEETGLALEPLRFEPAVVVLADAQRVCFMQPVWAPEPADAVAARIAATLARQPDPELCRLHVVRRAADLGPAVPPFVATFIREAFAQSG